MRQLRLNPFQLLIFILNSFSVSAALYWSGSWFQIMLPLNERDSFPYFLVLVLRWVSTYLDRIGSDFWYAHAFCREFLDPNWSRTDRKKVKIFLTFFRSTQDQTDRIAFSSNKNQYLDHVISISEIHQGSWRRLFILNVYGRIFLLKNSHRKEGFPEVIHLYTSSISFCKFFSWSITSSFLYRSSSKLKS